MKRTSTIILVGAFLLVLCMGCSCTSQTYVSSKASSATQGRDLDLEGLKFDYDSYQSVTVQDIMDEYDVFSGVEFGDEVSIDHSAGEQLVILVSLTESFRPPAIMWRGSIYRPEDIPLDVTSRSGSELDAYLFVMPRSFRANNVNYQIGYSVAPE